MAHDIEDTKKRLEEFKEFRKRAERKDAAKAAGFGDLDDYDAWSVLEELRHATLEEAARKRRKEDLKGGANNTFNIATSGAINPRATFERYYSGRLGNY